MTRYLLDTHVVVWSAIASNRFSAEVRGLLSDPDEEVYVSSVSVGEMVIKQQIGKLTLPRSPLEVVAALEMSELTLTNQHSQAVAVLPLHHRDPFDRWLIAQARVEGLTLITADPAMRFYEVEVLDPSR